MPVLIWRRSNFCSGILSVITHTNVLSPLNSIMPSGTARTFCARWSTISALAEYPERICTESGAWTAALISNWLAPFSSTPFGEIYSSSASNVRFCKAPIVSFTGIPSWIRPTSVSSILPLKIRSFILATVAIVVPSLNVLLMITELPTLIGTSRINPSMVERISVLLKEALFLVIPSLIISSASFAVCNSSRAFFISTSLFS